jgi:chemotaxis protein methyltransferase CheR
MFFKATSSSNRVEKGLMQQFAARLEESLGLNYSEKDWESLERKMDGAAKDFGCSDGKSCIQRLALQALSPEQVVLLAKHLTIGETYFFRDTPLFETLRTKLFPALIEKRREEGKFLRIWSAACCSGEEPYSLAILLNELIPDIADWTIWLMGSDINPNFIKKAEKGVYKQWSFRSTPSEIQKKYFRSALKSENNSILHLR